MGLQPEAYNRGLIPGFTCGLISRGLVSRGLEVHIDNF